MSSDTDPLPRKFCSGSRQEDPPSLTGASPPRPGNLVYRRRSKASISLFRRAYVSLYQERQQTRMKKGRRAKSDREFSRHARIQQAVKMQSFAPFMFGGLSGPSRLYALLTPFSCAVSRAAFGASAEGTGRRTAILGAGVNWKSRSIPRRSPRMRLAKSSRAYGTVTSSMAQSALASFFRVISAFCSRRMK